MKDGTPSKTKFYIIPDSGDTVYHLIAETGEALASHWCSNSGWAKYDLIEGRPERIREWSERFGDIEVMFLCEQNEITQDELLNRNKEWFESLPKEEAE